VRSIVEGTEAPVTVLILPTPAAWDMLNSNLVDRLLEMLSSLPDIR